MFRLFFVLPLVALTGCSNDECAQEASAFPRSEQCIIAGSCNAGDVAMLVCFPPAVSPPGHTLFVNREDDKVIGFATTEDSCIPAHVTGCNN